MVTEFVLKKTQQRLQIALYIQRKTSVLMIENVFGKKYQDLLFLPQDLQDVRVPMLRIERLNHALN